MKSFRVIMTNCAVRLPIIEIVSAKDKSHALNHVCKQHKVDVSQFVIVIVEDYENIASEDLIYSKNKYEFDADGKLLDYEIIKDESNDLIINLGGVSYNLGDMRTFIDVALSLENKSDGV